MLLSNKGMLWPAIIAYPGVTLETGESKFFVVLNITHLTFAIWIVNISV
jgi:hypothetical protein